MSLKNIGKGYLKVGKTKPVRNYNAKPPKLGGGQGIKANKTIANALGVSVGMPVHQQAVQNLMSHPDTNVVSEAKKLMKRY